MCAASIFVFSFEVPPADAAGASAALKDVRFSIFANGTKLVALI